MSFTSVALTGATQAHATVSALVSTKLGDGGSGTVGTDWITARADGGGAFSISVPANDDTTTVPQGTFYTFWIQDIHGGLIDEWKAVVPKASAPTAALSSLARLTPVAPAVEPYVVSVNGMSGVVTVAGGGGSTAGASIVRKFPFAYNTPGILTGAALYTPTIGDLLLDARFEIDTVWDGTTPLGDFGTFAGDHRGLFSAIAGFSPWDMTSPDQVFTGMSYSVQPSLAGQFALQGVQALMVAKAPGGSWSGAADAFIQALAGTLTNGNGLPFKFTSADPVKVCVSQDGTNTGADPGSTTGAAVLYLVTATPV